MKNIENSTSYTSNNGWREYVYGLISNEISALTRYCQHLIQFDPRKDDSKLIYNNVDIQSKSIALSFEELANTLNNGLSKSHRVVLLNGNINYEHDIQGTLSEIYKLLDHTDRVVLVAYNPYLRWLYRLAEKFGIRHSEPIETFITSASLNSIVKLSGFEIVRERTVAYCPFKLCGIGNIINSVVTIIPLLKRFAFSMVITLRPIISKKLEKPSVTIVIPARNEQGNIENALKRMPDFSGAKKEIIFVEGNSTDDTWNEIIHIAEKYKGQFQIKYFKQTGKGKNDAVRLGFANAGCDLLMILDADLTMPPELLPRFYDAYVNGLGDFINGNRLVYPMEGEAMKPLNHLGNIFFAKALSFVLGVPLGDSLCGTKVVSKKDHDRFIQWRNDFGDFDPFGDFELLFPAAILGLGIVDMPVRYRDRTYGTTNIRRFYHGSILLKMTLIGLFRIALGKKN